MAIEPRPQPAPGRPASPAVPRRDHERRDADPRWIFAVLVFIVVFGLSLHWILAGFLSLLQRIPSPSDPWRPLAHVAVPTPAAPSWPRLQVSAPAELRAFRAQEETELNSYGWINKTSGIVRLPIERAMDLVLQAGLPTRTATNQNSTGPSTYQLIQGRSEHRQPQSKGGP